MPLDLPFFKSELRVFSHLCHCLSFIRGLPEPIGNALHPSDIHLHVSFSWFLKYTALFFSQVCDTIP